MAERIVVVPAATMNQYFEAHDGMVIMRPEHLMEELELLSTEATLADRDTVETDETRLQIVAYVLVARPDIENNRVLFLGYRRPVSGGESRLHDRWSLGIGGHVSEEDGDSTYLPTSVVGGAYRELQEEAGVSPAQSCYLRPIGFIHEREEAVGRVHLGVVLLNLVQDVSVVQPQSESMADPQWRTLAEWLSSDLPLERWSRIAAETIQSWRTNRVQDGGMGLLLWLEPDLR